MSSSGQNAIRDRFEEIRRLISTPTPTIVDGGANRGNTVREFLRGYPQATIHAFEPIPELAADLARMFGGQPGVTIHASALGATAGTLQMNLTQFQAASSLLEPSAWSQAFHGAKLEVTQRVEVPVVRLDEVLANAAIDILKLDLQGYELEALRGAEGLLGEMRLICSEVEFIPLYAGQPLFGEVAAFLRRHGFRLHNLYELWTRPDGQLTAGDAIFLNERFFPSPPGTP